MESLSNVLNSKQYSTVDNNVNYSTVNSNSTVTSNEEVLESVPDLIPNRDYKPWYLRQMRLLGSARFMEFANKARAGSETPAVLFKWMLQNPDKVK